MAATVLTDKAVKRAKPGDKVRTLSDSGGLQLRISETGTKTWRLAYRFKGTQKSLVIGQYPTVSLAEARQRRDEAKKHLADGGDPGAQKQDAKRATVVETNSMLVSVAEAYFDKLIAEGRTAATLDKNRWLFAFMSADVTARSVASLKASDLLPSLKVLEARGLTQSAGRLRGLLGSIFRFAAANGLCESDPTSLLKGALAQHQSRSRSAITEANKFGVLIKAVWTYQGQPETVACLKLLALLVPRPGELRMAEWSEFDFDEAIWEIPAGRMKMRRPHRCPLSPQALAILIHHREIARQSKLLFPGLRSAQRSISENTTNGALRRLGFSKEEATSHGFRASFSTLANESGKWHPDAIERQLAHIEENKVRAAYSRGEHWQERVEMMKWWGDEINRMLHEIG